MKQNEAKQLIFCGSHSLKTGFQGKRECDVAEAYFRRKYTEHAGKFEKEGKSTTIPENWLFMKVNFQVRRIHLVTITPLLPRISFLCDWIYGDEGTLSFETLPWPASDFPHERRRLQDAECTIKIRQKMPRGKHKLMLKADDSSKWNDWRLEHQHNCLSYGGLVLSSYTFSPILKCIFRIA